MCAMLSPFNYNFGFPFGVKRYRLFEKITLTAASVGAGLVSQGLAG